MKTEAQKQADRDYQAKRRAAKRAALAERVGPVEAEAELQAASEVPAVVTEALVKLEAMEVPSWNEVVLLIAQTEAAVLKAAVAAPTHAEKLEAIDAALELADAQRVVVPEAELVKRRTAKWSDTTPLSDAELAEAVRAFAVKHAPTDAGIHMALVYEMTDELINELAGKRRTKRGAIDKLWAYCKAQDAAKRQAA